MLFYNSLWCPLCIQLLLSRLALCLAALLAWHILCQGWARVSLVRSHLGVNTVLDGLRGELLLLLNFFLTYIRPENDDDGRKDTAPGGKLTLSELEVALLTASLTLSMVTNDDAGSGV